MLLLIVEGVAHFRGHDGEYCMTQLRRLPFSRMRKAGFCGHIAEIKHWTSFFIGLASFARRANATDIR